MGKRIPITKLIEDLLAAGCYDEFSRSRLDILCASPPEIVQKERSLIQAMFAQRVQKIEKEGVIRFDGLGSTTKFNPRDRIACDVKEFLGFGNMGPVYSVKVGKETYALKIYSGASVNQMMETHGKCGLGGLLEDIRSEDPHKMLSSLGKKVLGRRPWGVYGRCNRVVKVHNVGVAGDLMFVLMDMLAVDPINKVDPAEMGGDIVDIVSWGVDCAVGLCQLHVEERRLHLNIRPEAFIRKQVTDDRRLPRFTFFHFPKQFNRPQGSPCRGTEFITVDHLDNSIDIDDKSPKGIGTFGSWLYMPPEVLQGLVMLLREDYDTYVTKRRPPDKKRTITVKRSPLDDIWALGLTLFQFLAGGKTPFAQARSLADIVRNILMTEFDFSLVDARFRDLLSAMLEKNRRDRYQRVMDGCPAKMKAGEMPAEAILYKLERIAMEC